MEEGFPNSQLFTVRVEDNNFSDIIHLLTTEANLEAYTRKQKKELVVRATNFSVITGDLYKMGDNEILRRYVPDFE